MPSFHGRCSNPSDLSHLKLSEASVKALQDVWRCVPYYVRNGDDEPPCKKKRNFTLCLTPFCLGTKKSDFRTLQATIQAWIGFLLGFFLGCSQCSNFPKTFPPQNLAHSCRTWVPRWGHWCHPGNSEVSTCWNEQVGGVEGVKDATFKIWLAALHLDLPVTPRFDGKKTL